LPLHDRADQKLTSLYFLSHELAILWFELVEIAENVAVDSIDRKTLVGQVDCAVGEKKDFGIFRDVMWQRELGSGIMIELAELPIEILYRRECLVVFLRERGDLAASKEIFVLLKNNIG
jgi:hypothetical protein